MARYILIDNNSGYIYADTADLHGFDGSMRHGDEAMILAARLTDEHIGCRDRSYEAVMSDPRTNEGYYRVYRADVGGSEAVPVVEDGQDQFMIDAVVEKCAFVGCVRYTDAEDDMDTWIESLA